MSDKIAWKGGDVMKRGAALRLVLTVLSCLSFSITAFADFDSLKPSQPSDFEAVMKGDGTIALTWGESLYADGYIIEKSADGAEYITVAENVTETAYTDKESEGFDRYRITPYNKNGMGIQSKATVGAGLKKGVTLASEREFSDLAGVDNYLYALGSGDNILTVFKINQDEILLITDVANKEKFTPQAIYAHGDYLYIASKIPRGGYNVMVYSVKDRENPIFQKAVSTVQILGFCQEGDYLFGTAGSSGVAVLDIKEPEKISLVTYISADGTVNACYADDNILYAATSAGKIKSYNITNFKSAFSYKDLEYDFKRYLWQQTVEDNWTGETGGYVRTFSYPANFKSIYEKNGIVYAGGAYGIKISDFTSYKKPEYITEKDSTASSELSVIKLIPDGKLLYAAAAKNFHVYNIQNPKEAVRTNTYYPFQAAELAGIYIMNDRLAAVNKNGYITIYDK